MDADDLMPRVYEELRAIARERLAHERRGHTLQATALVHEVYRRLQRPGVRFEDDRVFVAAAARAMRNVLIDHARGRRREKRGGPALRRQAIDIQSVADLAAHADPETVEAIEAALASLARLDPVAEQVVHLRFFGALSNETIAHTLGISLATVKRKWQFARAWLHRELESAGTATRPGAGGLPA